MSDKLTRDQVHDKIINLIAQQLNISKDKVTDNSTLESLGADSLDRFEIVMNLEEEFSIAIKDEDAENLINVGQVIDYIYNLVDSK